MKNILMSKITLIAAVGGAVLALLLGLFSGVDFISIIIRMLIAGLVLGGAALGLQIVFPKLIGEEAMKVLFPNWDGGENSDPLADDSQSKPRVDITDDSEMSADDLYSGGEPMESSSHDSRSTDFTDDSGYPDDHVSSNTPPSQNQQFRELDFESSAPKVYPKEEDMGHIAHQEEDGGSGNGDYVADEFNRLKERAKESPAQDSSEFKESNSSDAVFKVKNTRITADPKIIAKAIKTVMNRD